MVRVEIVVAKLSELGARTARVRKHTPATAAELLADQDTLDLVSFNLMLSVQSASDIASHLVSDEGWRPASSPCRAAYRPWDRTYMPPCRTLTAKSASGRHGRRSQVANRCSSVKPASTRCWSKAAMS